jgi:hypothetical protein
MLSITFDDEKKQESRRRTMAEWFEDEEFWKELYPQRLIGKARRP